MKRLKWRAAVLTAGLMFGAPATASQPQLSLPQWSPDPGWEFSVATRAPAPDLAVQEGSDALYQSYQRGRELTRTGVIVIVAGYSVAGVGALILLADVLAIVPSELEGYGNDPLYTTGSTLVVGGGLAVLTGTIVTSVGAGKAMQSLHLAGADINRRPGRIALGCLGTSALTSGVAPGVSSLANLGFVIFGIRQLVENKNAGNAHEAMGGFALQLAPQRVGDTNGLALTGRW